MLVVQLHSVVIGTAVVMIVRNAAVLIRVRQGRGADMVLSQVVKRGKPISVRANISNAKDILGRKLLLQLQVVFPECGCAGC